jgi:ABC-type Zn uptake system ZnuABC Zn-binding protein ZnuA
MLIDLLIELKVAEARKESATEIRMRAEVFCKQMNAKKAEFQKDVNKYKTRVAMYEQEIHQFKEKLADPDMETLPPKVFQNKVTIYPVRVED